ncbi:hypothetical protein MEA186_12883 [Mesorhizobium amorphae CCNWGS0123]|uniref:Uncharacterized protein n=1 Tax=Mesorhizobium amorphae CCNWGS0123 TaxID=1082933 RepID=G6Y9F7_9HYPH|nr:hypothetical protein MEA186_12883 [Mesorhizobium amorphae CCNWGS0123]
MRWALLIIIAGVAGFYLWDQLANDGKYTAQVERGFDQAASFPGELGIQVTFN